MYTYAHPYIVTTYSYNLLKYGMLVTQFKIEVYDLLRHNILYNW